MGNERQIGSRYQTNKDKIELIKTEMVKAHDQLVEMGIYPNLRKILKMLPFWVHEGLGTEIRQGMVEEGRLPSYKRGIKRPERDNEARMNSKPTSAQIRAAASQIKHEALMASKMPQVVVPPPTLKEAARWAIGRYREAWRSICDIRRQGSLQKPWEEPTGHKMGSYQTVDELLPEGDCDWEDVA